MTEVFEGTWEEVAQHAPELRGKRVRLLVIPSEGSDQDAPQAETVLSPRTLADRLGSFIGAGAGTGEAYSERTGERFTEYLVEKRSEGCL